MKTKVSIYHCDGRIYAEDGYMICDIAPDDTSLNEADEANEVFIVRAANAYDILVGAINEVLSSGDYAENSAASIVLKTALTKAGAI